MWHSTLTQTERNNWNAWATAQNRVHTSLAQTALSGQQWFLKLNITLYGGAFPINHLPPVNLDVTQPNNLAIVRVKVSTHEFLITYTPFALGADIISWKATKPISPGKTSWLCNIQWFSYALGNTTQPFNAWNDYLALWGTPVAGKKIGITCYILNSDTGAISQSLRAETIVLA
jgi:hypothetical protein